MARTKARMTRAVIVMVMTFFIVGTATAAAQDQAPTLTVNPSSGLVDDQAIELRGSNFFADDPFTGLFDSGTSSFALVCPVRLLDSEPFDGSDLVSIGQQCGGVALRPTSTDASGELTGALRVSRSMPPVFGDQSVQCGIVPDDCFVFAGSLRMFPRTVSLLGYATAIISFSPTVPSTTQECMNAGWRQYTDDEGRFFKSQGRCIKLVQGARTP